MWGIYIWRRRRRRAYPWGLKENPVPEDPEKEPITEKSKKDPITVKSKANTTTEDPK